MLLDNLVTLEDLNSILLLKPDVCFDYEIDCSLLPSTNFNETYYDFNTISMSKETSGDFKDKYHYVLKVYNKLWTGGISFKDIPSEEEEPLWYTDISRNYNNELYIVHILTDYTDFKILSVLHPPRSIAYLSGTFSTFISLALMCRRSWKQRSYPAFDITYL